MMKIPSALTIAGTDPTGGAGIQADLKTFQELKSYGMSVITSVVAQNTTGVQDVHHIPLDMLQKQLDAVFSDMPVHAIKTGMIANIDMMEVIQQTLQHKQIPLVMDPVMVATSGDALIHEDARIYLQKHLLPLCALVTPNLPETEFLTGRQITNQTDMMEAAKTLVHEYGVDAALIKGGHLDDEEAIDFLYNGREMISFSEKRIDTQNTHGTGCTYSAAITAYLSHGDSMQNAVEKGKQFVTAAIRDSFNLGAGAGPTNHWAIREEA